MARRTGYVYHEGYMFHNNGDQTGWYPSGIRPSLGVYNQPLQHYENPETKRRLHELVSVSGLLDHLQVIRPKHAKEEDVCRVHQADYVEKIKSLSFENGGDAGDFAPVGVGSFEIAMLAVGGVIEAVQRVCKGELDNAYCLVRPPGHHAEKNMGRGFCIFNNIAIGAKYALDVLGIDKIVILDWDVHHGNGTQQAFYDDPRVLFISIHQDGLFPAKEGALSERGTNSGFGYNINVPIPPGSGIGCYRSFMERIVKPSCDAFAPGLIMISCGFDAACHDPIAHIMLPSSSFASMTEIMVSIADKHCSGKLVLVHEGGYSPVAVPFCGVRVLEKLVNVNVDVVDPYEEEICDYPYQELQAHQNTVIEKAENLVEELRDIELKR